MYQLFTVTVTAMIGSISSQDAGVMLDSLVDVLTLSGILDAAVTIGDGSISFTGQVESASALEAVSRASTAMVLAGHTRLTTLEAETFIEEDHAFHRNVRLALA